MSVQAMIGAGLTIFGVMIAILRAIEKPKPRPKANQGAASIGIALGSSRRCARPSAWWPNPPWPRYGPDRRLGHSRFDCVKRISACFWLGVFGRPADTAPRWNPDGPQRIGQRYAGHDALLLALRGDVGMVSHSVVSYADPVVALLWLRCIARPLTVPGSGQRQASGPALILSR